jgi:CheY-like chemotaxis protein
VVSNLLNNAARYTPAGGTVRVAARADGGEAVIEVIDDGEGIERDLVDHIFGAFVQARAGGGGLGLGLHLVQHLVRLHAGTVRAFSEGPGHGARFEVRLPLADELPLPAREEAESVPPPARARPLSIVVVEDQEDVREMVVLLLRRWGHDVRAVGQGGDGIRMVVQAPPDVVLLDIGLPDMDGYSVAEALRGELDGACPPLVAVTGWGQDNDRRRAFEVGFSHHLVKPVSPRALRRVLAEVSVSRSETGSAARPEETCKELDR